MLTKHRRFAEEYVKDHNAKEAAIRAGYAETRAAPTGSELSRRPDVSAYIADLEDDFREEMGITIRGQLTKLSDIYKSAMEAESFPSAVKAVELQSKIAGLLVERRESVTIEHRVFTLGFDRDLLDD